MGDDTRIREAFDAVSALPREQWEQALHERCPDAADRDRVRRLLDAHARAEGFLSRPAATEFPGLARGVVETVGEFRIIREVGRGGMGVVYLARDTELDRDVALKVLAGHLVSSDHAIARFRHEAKAAARLKHPGVVAVHRYGESDGLHYIAMEFVEGDTLAQRLDARRAAGGADPRLISGATDHRRFVARVIADIADALEYAHRNGVIHRDVKPSNVLIDERGAGRLTDFGIAKFTAEETITATGDRPGTYYYMSPEQASAVRSEIDHRSDIFSLGVVLYEALSLHRPFEGHSAAQVLEAIRTQPAPALRRFGRDIPADLAVICHKSLEKRPADRYQTAAHMAADLRCWLAGAPILARPPSAARRSIRWLRRHRAASVAGAFLLVALASAAFAWIAYSQWKQGTVVLDITCETPGARVYAQRVDERSLEHGPPRPLGAAPLRRRLEPGYYRITLVGDDGAFAEHDELLDPAARATVSLRARLLPASEANVGMVLVPAGLHKIGRASTVAFERAREIPLPEFWIDEREVSQADFRKYVEATGAPEPSLWREYGYDEAFAEHPMVGLVWAEMRAYAAWAGKRLPTHPEWEAAARWPDGRTLPWDGDVSDELPRPTAQHFINEGHADGNVRLLTYKALTRPVWAADATRSVLGLRHTFGNASEATSTVLFDRNRTVVIKGGSYLDAPEVWGLERNASTLPTGYPSLTVGFRCARSARPVSDVAARP